ncbi:hypothetical protein Nepgr_000537 [Nepenthes gracilis]|uniref:non-specific serine/threonine protein kinase n=1 Tax=Nepenthes gracilis TaxID=150966 RepID=A0AAD3RWX7_NEPGR|nr:hypothetical protein Nepgr_000537 [Nepenthes gracilis]
MSLQIVRLGKTGLWFVLLLNCCLLAESTCTKGCDLALASYYAWSGVNLTFISTVLDASVSDILSYNTQISSKDSFQSGTRVNVPFSCDCIKEKEILGHIFEYTMESGDTYEEVATLYYSNLTTANWIQEFNNYSADNIPAGSSINVTVNCSCGNSSVSDSYGLFITYPLRPGDTLNSVASYANVTNVTLLEYNPNVNFSAGTGLVYIPARDKNGKYPSLTSSKGGASRGVIAGVSIAVIAVVILLAAYVYFGCIRRKKMKKASLLPDKPGDPLTRAGLESSRTTSSGYDRGTAGVAAMTIDKSVEFSYEELAKETDNFSMANKIGQGGFGAVYYAELRGEKAAIKKMDMQATREFLAELKVLTHVHHLNLVRLIGYCVEGSLFLVYEYIENGNLNQHLRGSGRDPLTWSNRVQIALDSARGLEYIHEHTVPVYIHRDIKSANILIDNNFHAKVADFGLTKLTEAGTTRLVGTFGYMPPEYAQYGEVSAKVDVYAFGVVLYELISAKEAIVKENDPSAESKGLVGLFEDVLSQPDPSEIRKLVDPRLGENYPLDSVLKMARLAKACTHENPHLRPSMRSVVVALMTLSSTTEDWDVGLFYENPDLVSLMSGR